MRSTLFPVGLALILPVTALVGACGPPIDTETTGGGGSATTMNGGTAGTVAGNAGVGGTVAGDAGGGVGGTGGNSGTGGAIPPANDVCPGELIPLAVGATKSVKGTLKGAADDYTTFCADMDPEMGAPDVVYQLDIPADSSVSFKLDGVGFIPAMSLRKSDCTQRNGPDQCVTLGTGNVQLKVALEAGTYWIVIDSADKNVGDFTLDVTVSAPACGDGVVNPGEQCDPQMPANDDGCINPGMAKGCQYGEPPPDPAIVKCPGGMITIAVGDKFILGPYNNGSGELNNDNKIDDPQGDGTGPCPSAAYGPEDVFRVVPTGDGKLKVTIGHTENGAAYCEDPMNTCGDFILYMREGSCDMGTQLVCDDVDEAGNLEVLSISSDVKANMPYWVFVDSYQDTPMNPMFGPYPGPYYLELELAP